MHTHPTTTYVATEPVCWATDLAHVALAMGLLIVNHSGSTIRLQMESATKGELNRRTILGGKV